MSVPVFQCDGSLPGCPATEIAAGGSALCRLHSHAACLSAFDAVTGIARPPAVAARWFGSDISALAAGQLMRVLRRMAPMAPDGGLLGNVRMAENILLPCEARGRGAAGVAELGEALARAPWDGWFPEPHLWVLPFQASGLERALAGVLRAWLARPDAVVACNPGYHLEHGERAVLADALAWLRTEQPGCAWLFIQTESALPPGFAANSLHDEQP